MRVNPGPTPIQVRYGVVVNLVDFHLSSFEDYLTSTAPGSIPGIEASFYFIFSRYHF